MTEYVQLTRMAPAALAPTARALCAALAGTPGSGELGTGLVPIGSKAGTAPTWFVTGGQIEDVFAAAMKDPALMHGYCEALGLPTTLVECEQLLGACVIDDREPLEVMAEMGLELARGIIQ
jgi:hypothetical protein